MRRKLLVSAIALTALVVASPADALTRKQLRNRSAEICANANRAMQPANDKARAAADRGDWDAYVHYARKLIRIGDPYIARLAGLDAPPKGLEIWQDFIDHTLQFVQRFKEMVNAVDARRSEEVIARRERRVARQSRLAQRAARAYPLRDACVELIAAN